SPTRSSRISIVARSATRPTCTGRASPARSRSPRGWSSEMPGLLRRLSALLIFATLASWPTPITAQAQPGKFNREEFRGRVVLLDFWATWCAPCLEELPRLRRLHETREADGLAIVGVALDATDRRALTS